MRAFLLCFSFVMSSCSWAAEEIRIGVYDFPPYVFMSDKVSGITIEMIAKMNQLQNDYEFVAVPTTSRRRYSDFKKNKFDVLMFESKKWGWEGYPVVASKPFVSGGELYVTKADKQKTQAYFNHFEQKVMVGVLGYHYQFANFSADLDYLDKHFNIIQTDSQKRSIELILNNRGDIAVLSKAYLNYHFSNSPEDKAKLLISDKFDQIYRHTILIRQPSKITIEYVNNLLEQMKRKASLDFLWQQYGLEVIH
ncbi:transporter substrate-binding domain-containing protein [Litorilituus sediminis]|uniref:Transporter substrate-binding domain-containing protein n=2 Tax=Litorilituus sediminis TaxID=718192 RepID=A0A4P6P6E2_9GAMM|nr:transporter substrate-binding domain-containing protein [Litorilituus sediminis]